MSELAVPKDAVWLFIILLRALYRITLIAHLVMLNGRLTTVLSRFVGLPTKHQMLVFLCVLRCWPCVLRPSAPKSFDNKVINLKIKCVL